MCHCCLHEGHHDDDDVRNGGKQEQKNKGRGKDESEARETVQM